MDFWILWNEYSWHIAQVGMQVSNTDVCILSAYDTVYKA
jgi:hypothetical protein